jgi:peptidoglycan/LPS O-acetylase OafA/YrhL
VKYRSSVDGLRGIAVAFVVLFHAGLPPFSGGYIGVDIFFVISGYLITNLILEETRNGTFSILSFYERRARRILPALVSVSICTAIIAYLLLPPDLLKNYAQSLAAVGIFSSNFLFYIEAGYFSIDAELKPLLHTWSLAIEEQFYLVFPLLFVFVRARKHQVLVVTSVSLLSIGLMLIKGKSDPLSTFYLLPFRFWEIGAGSIAAMCCGSSVFESKKLNSAISVIGFLCISLSFLVIDTLSNHPGPITLLPIVGTVLMLISMGEQGLVGRMLSLKPIVGLGLVSYSFYLWHWPLLVFLRVQSFHPPSIAEKLFVVLFSLLIAIFSWRFVERPFRQRVKGALRKSVLESSNPIFYISAAFLAFLICAGSLGHLADGFPERVNEQGLSYKGLKERRLPNFGYSEKCDGASWLPEECRDTESTDIIVWGDSYAMHLVNAVRQASPGLGVGQITSSGCAPINGMAKFRPSDPSNPLSDTRQCLKFNNEAVQTILESPSVKVVVISSMFNYLGDSSFQYMTNAGIRAANVDEILEALLESVKPIQDKGIQVVLVTPPPRSGENIGRCLDLALWKGESLNQCAIVEADLEQVATTLRGSLARINKTLPVVSLYKILCADGMCAVAMDGEPLYRDSGHLSRAGSTALGNSQAFRTALHDASSKITKSR